MNTICWNGARCFGNNIDVGIVERFDSLRVMQDMKEIFLLKFAISMHLSRWRYAAATMRKNHRRSISGLRSGYRGKPIKEILSISFLVHFMETFARMCRAGIDEASYPTLHTKKSEKANIESLIKVTTLYEILVINFTEITIECFGLLHTVR